MQPQARCRSSIMEATTAASKCIAMVTFVALWRDEGESGKTSGHSRSKREQREGQKVRKQVIRTYEGGSLTTIDHDSG